MAVVRLRPALFDASFFLWSRESQITVGIREAPQATVNRILLIG
jgi:hypothetical protein